MVTPPPHWKVRQIDPLSPLENPIPSMGGYGYFPGTAQCHMPCHTGYRISLNRAYSLISSFPRISTHPLRSLQCRRFLWARNLLAKARCWNFPKRGGDRASQRERGGGGEREEKTPARKHCENEKHPLIRRAWPLFQKWAADNNKTISHPSPKTRIVLRKTSWSLSLFLSWPSHNAILNSWWSFSLSCNSFF